MMDNRIRFNFFLFVSTFARALIEVFISIYLYKNGFSIGSVLLFYLLENLFALLISYCYVKVGEKFGYSIVMCIGVLFFVLLQIFLNNIVHSDLYIVLISLLYSLYRRGYWVARRYYVTEVMPQNDSSKPFSVMVVVGEVASVLAGFLGGLLLDSFNAFSLTIISSLLLFLSVTPLLFIRNKVTNRKIELIKNLKKYDKRNYLAFSLYEINNLLAFIFPIFIMLYVKDTYMMAGSVNAVSSLAIIVFVLLYGRIIQKKNYFILSSVLFIMICFLKLFFFDYFILIIYFIGGIIEKMQRQSVSKIYFENRNGMDLTHYNLIYQIVEALARVIVVVPLLFMSDVRVMIIFVLLVICGELVIYSFLRKNQKLC